MQHKQMDTLELQAYAYTDEIYLLVGGGGTLMVEIKEKSYFHNTFYLFFMGSGHFDLFSSVGKGPCQCLTKE